MRCTPLRQGVRELAVAVLPSWKSNVAVVVHCPLTGHRRGVVTKEPPVLETTGGILKSIERTAILPSGGPPGTVGGLAVIVEPLMRR